jgi:hypothetical protein
MLRRSRSRRRRRRRRKRRRRRGGRRRRRRKRMFSASQMLVLNNFRALRSRRPDCSAATVASDDCMRSSRNAVCSHVSRRSATEAAMAGAPAPAT